MYLQGPTDSFTGSWLEVPCQHNKGGQHTQRTGGHDGSHIHISASIKSWSEWSFSLLQASYDLCRQQCVRRHKCCLLASERPLRRCWEDLEHSGQPDNKNKIVWCLFGLVIQDVEFPVGLEVLLRNTLGKVLFVSPHSEKVFGSIPAWTEETFVWSWTTCQQIQFPLIARKHAIFIDSYHYCPFSCHSKSAQWVNRLYSPIFSPLYLPEPFQSGFSDSISKTYNM